MKCQLYYVMKGLKTHYAICRWLLPRILNCFCMYIGNPNVESALPDLKQVCIVMISLFHLVYDVVVTSTVTIIIYYKRYVYSL